MDWRKTGQTDGEIWNGKDSNLKENDELEGRYIDKEINVGPNKSNLYHIETDDGTVVKVWGSTVIDGNMDEIARGKYVRIVYNGLKKGKTGKEYKSYTIWEGIDTPGDEG